jgi:hypothetical protein
MCPLHRDCTRYACRIFEQEASLEIMQVGWMAQVDNSRLLLNQFKWVMLQRMLRKRAACCKMWAGSSQ